MPINLHSTDNPILVFFITLTLSIYNKTTINLVFIFKCSSFPHDTVCTRRVDLSTLTFSLSSHRHSYIGLLFSSLKLLFHNKQSGLSISRLEINKLLPVGHLPRNLKVSVKWDSKSWNERRSTIFFERRLQIFNSRFISS